MPPKKGKKKEVHKVPEEDWRVTRRREQERKAAEKKFKRELKRINKRKKYNTTAPSSDSENSDNEEFSQDETKATESMPKQDIDSPCSSYTEPSISCTSRHQEHLRNFSGKVKKKVDVSHSFVQKTIGSYNSETTSSTTGQQVNKPSSKSSTSSTMGQQVNQSDINKGKKDPVLPNKPSNKPSISSTMGQQINQSDSNKGKKDPVLPNKPSNKPSISSTMGQQVNQSDNDKGKRISCLPDKPSNKPCASITIDQGAIPKTRTIRAPPKEKSISKHKTLELETPKNITEGKKFDGKITASGVDKPSTDSVGKKLDKKHRDKMLKDENKEFVGKKSIQSKDLVSSASNIATPAVHSKSIGDLTDKRSVLEQKLKASKSEMKSLHEKEKLLSSVEKDVMAAIGAIKLRSKEISAKIRDKKLKPISVYDPYNKMVFLGDKNIEISMKVNQGSQVICKVKNLQQTASRQNVVSGSETVEGHASANSDAISETENLEEYNKTTKYTKYSSKTYSKFPNVYYKTVDNQAELNLNRDTLTEPEVHKTTPETKRISRREKIEKLCSDYLKNVDSVLENFDRVFKNYLKHRKDKQT